jgi:hypothetical protein
MTDADVCHKEKQSRKGKRILGRYVILKNSARERRKVGGTEAGRTGDRGSGRGNYKFEGPGWEQAR